MPIMERQEGEGLVSIRGFSGHGFRVGERVHASGLLIWPEAAMSWSPPLFDALALEDFAALEAINPGIELLLLGSGASLRRPARALVEALNARGIGVEPMDSRAAARTYNLLAGEARRVAAALYPLNA